MSTHLLDRLAAAKLWLVSEPNPGLGTPSPDAPKGLPYLSHALYALVPVVTTEVESIRCDEHWRVYVNPGWLATTEIPELARHLAHLCWHLLLDHSLRAQDQDVDECSRHHWGVASDLTVTHTLDPDGLAPPGLPAACSLGLGEGRSAEEYFSTLSRLPAADPDGRGGRDGPGLADEGCGSAADGLRRGYELPPDAESGAVDPDDARQIRRRVAIEYREHVGGRGTTPGDAWRWTVRILEPRVPWEQVLSSAVRRAVGWASGRTDYTYTRPSRRQGAVPGVVLPGTRRPVPAVAMVVDTSGSVDDRLLGRALGEVDGALRALGVGGSSVHVLACDAAVPVVTRVRRARDARLAGGGGTDMRVGLKAAGALRPRAELVVVLTDGYTPWPPDPPVGAAVVVALLGRDRRQLPPTPSWATRVECLLD